MHKDLKFGPSKEAGDETWFATHPFHGVAQFMLQMWDIEAADMASFNPFELLPKALTRVELRCIGWQAFQVDPLRRAIGQKLANDVTAVDRGPIPDKDHAAGYLAQQVFQEGHHVRRVHSVILTLDIQFAL